MLAVPMLGWQPLTKLPPSHFRKFANFHIHPFNSLELLVGDHITSASFYCCSSHLISTHLSCLQECHSLLHRSQYNPRQPLPLQTSQLIHHRSYYGEKNQRYYLDQKRITYGARVSIIHRTSYGDHPQRCNLLLHRMAYGYCHHLYHRTSYGDILIWSISVL